MKPRPEVRAPEGLEPDDAGLAALLDRQIVSGVDTTFKMILTAMALVAGTLIANIVVPSRREL